MIVPALTFLLFSIMSFAFGGNVDFSGDCKQDKEKTDHSYSQLFLSKITLIQKRNSLATTRTCENEYGEQYPFDENLRLDGQESEILIYEMPRKTSARWSENGTLLSIEFTASSSYGDSSGTYYFRK
jgi:hypothetical protein